MDFYFYDLENGKADFNHEFAVVSFSIDKDFPVLRVDVDLGEIPGANNTGYEVIVDFKALNFDNNQTFYTDSNGLEMQKRILNYRPTWDIQANYNDSNENVTANYYPINSAISMKDIHSDRVFTVMNGRS
jgi:lysosomal alpha-mannosidase